MPAAESTLWDKVLPTILSSVIVILLFIIGRLLDSIIKSKEITRNWYQKVIIDPNIQKLNVFYDDTLKQLKTSIEHLVSVKSTLPFDDYIAAKAIEMNKFKIIKRAFENEFILLVQTNFHEISEELSEHIRDLEDEITRCLDKSNINNADFLIVEREIMSKKHCLFGILFKPLAFKKLTITSIFQAHF